ncbi:MAG: hypothetical protein LBL90_12465 [Prevotellaceae bacterium]|nr:hypothetical protein [Prevotellaceae bacterium]
MKGRSLGRASCFTPEGKIALMLLKFYSCSSDKDLIAQHNANNHYLLFCRVCINPLGPLSNFNIVRETLCWIGHKPDNDKLQQVLASPWKAYLENTSVLTADAACYKSAIHFPIDVKILLEPVYWVYPH